MINPMKNITNQLISQQEITQKAFISGYFPSIRLSEAKPEVKPKKRRATREELRNRTREENSKLYNRRWPKATKKQRDELNLIFTPRNSFRFDCDSYVTSCNNIISPLEPPRSNIYIYTRGTPVNFNETYTLKGGNPRKKGFSKPVLRSLGVVEGEILTPYAKRGDTPNERVCLQENCQRRFSYNYYLDSKCFCVMNGEEKKRWHYFRKKLKMQRELFYRDAWAKLRPKDEPIVPLKPKIEKKAYMLTPEYESFVRLVGKETAQRIFEEKEADA